MKKNLSKFGSNLIAKDQLKYIRGGAACDACSESECKGNCGGAYDVCGWSNGACECTIIAAGGVY
jgi:hypothetical protein